MPAVTIKQKIIDRITEDIRSGVLAPGDKLPTSPQLQRDFGALSLEPVRAAIAELKVLGLVEFVPGKGVYVTDKISGQ